MYKLLAGFGLLWVVMVFTSIAAWITHVIVSIKAGAWVLLAVGAFVFPVGIIHGIGSWFGIF